MTEQRAKMDGTSPALTAGQIVERYGSLIVLFGLFAAMSVASDRFLAVDNLTNVARQISINMIIACGMTLIIISGGIDLSVGSLTALAGCVGMTVLVKTGSSAAGVFAGLATGLLAGIFNGAAVAWARLPPFIVTLASLTILRGLALMLTGGSPIIVTSGAYLVLGRGDVLGLPVPILLMILTVVAVWILLSRTSFGAHLYALGGNEEAARLSGVRVAYTKFAAYAACGALSGLAGMVLAARLSSAQPNTGEGFELDAIAAVVLGGTSLMGGRGSVWGTVVGACVIGILNNGFNLMAVDSHVQLVAKGLIILLAVFADQFLKRK